MARSAQPVRPAVPAGAVAAALAVMLTLAPLAAVMWRAEAPGGLGPADWAAIRFSVWQALISAALSVALAIPVVRALARQSFAGRGLLVMLLGAPFILPVIVAIFGLLAVFGQNGLLRYVTDLIGLPPIRIYGLHGIVLANVFFNLPLATRLLLQGWQAIPSERFRLAASLGMDRAEIHRFLERPMLREAAPGALAIIFLVCTTSFAIALALGGGPRATTVELAIYQAFRFDFDLAKAALLAGVQFLITLIAALISFRFSVPAVLGAGLDRDLRRWDAQSGWPRALDAAAIAAAALFLLLPLTMVVLRGAPAIAGIGPDVWQAALRSLIVAVAAAGLTVGLALALSTASTASRLRPVRRGYEAAGYLGIAISPLVIGTGLYVMIFPFANPVGLALPVTVLVNAALALPFALRILLPAVQATERDFGRLADSLALTGITRLRWLLLPRLRRPLGFAAGLSAALSMGDLGVIALFADPRQATLPLEMYRLMAAYRTEDAAGAALLLLILSLALFWLFDRGGRINADA
ncbi:MAG: thiamine/thiamine pyrophosphate ABC transporter permease ThiP [Rhodobacteraceae bacterium]|nr:thiamine/thiamine pyrophosphate ABC transporter permease ThiP [Paracoccaceae bacterium]